jgi:glutamyl-tRNA reductase
MNLLLAGLNHKTAPLPLRERLAVLDPGKTLHRLRSEGFSEGVLIATCNRFELYALAPKNSGRGAEDLAGFLEREAGSPIGSAAYRMENGDAVRHLFEVASGLDSLVVGETDILGQVKDSYALAKEAGMTGKVSNVLFQRSIFVGKRVRTETAISVGPTSVASVAVDLASRIFGNLSDCAVLILGAGSMAQTLARTLRSRSAKEIAVANRNGERGRELASECAGKAVPWEEFPKALAIADIVIASTSSPTPIVDSETVGRAMKSRMGRSLFLIDIAMPRNVDEGVHGLDHVYLYRMEDLETIVAESLKNREGELQRASRIVHEKASEFSRWLDSVMEGREISLTHSEHGEIS